jgi:hypothetical protein
MWLWLPLSAILVTHLATSRLIVLTVSYVGEKAVVDGLAEAEVVVVKVKDKAVGNLKQLSFLFLLLCD